MNWLFKHFRSSKHQNKASREASLKLEQLESRTMLDAQPVLIDINPTPSVHGSSPRNFTEMNGSVFFSASHPSTGHELWVTDGTSAGTQLVKDININYHSFPASLQNINNTLFFIANDGIHGEELWRSDGTSAGTYQVSSQPSSIREILNVDGDIYLYNGRDLWKSDGTSTGTELILSLEQGDFYHSEFVPIEDKLFFTTTDANSGTALWVTGGTSAGVQRIHSIPNIPFGNARYLAATQDTLFFAGWDANEKIALWKIETESSLTSPILVLESDTDVQDINHVTNVNGSVFFSVKNEAQESSLWVSDGTSSGTQFLHNLDNTSLEEGIRQIENVNGIAYINNHRIPYASDQVWISDGTPEGTTLLSEEFSSINQIENFIEVNGYAYFTAFLTSTGDELWRSDGTPEGTVLVADILPGPAASIVQEMKSINGTLYFQAYGIDENGKDIGNELWLYEYSPPELEITPDETVTTDDPILFTFQFSEAVTGFELEDIDITNGTAGVFTAVDEDTYTLEVMAIEDGEVTVNVVAGVAEDAGTNGNLAAIASVEYGSGVVFQSFVELFDHAPSEEAKTYWNQVLADEGYEVAVEGIVYSAERWEQIVEETYQELLGRSSYGDEGQSYWVNILVNRLITQTEFETFVFVSEEYLSTHPIDVMYLDTLSEHLYDRELTTDETTYYLEKIEDEVPPQAIIEEFLDQEEWRLNVIRNAYIESLGRPIDEEGEAFWENFLETGGTVTDFLVEILTSEEFMN
ncbi:Hypothetical protein PBC10988_18780 [Planctomycetales bacterium 10988]|nr:Hypothetical protein PBC10988_18780 [Planctomycetales bacterium 10988]